MFCFLLNFLKLRGELWLPRLGSELEAANSGRGIAEGGVRPRSPSLCTGGDCDEIDDDRRTEGMLRDPVLGFSFPLMAVDVVRLLFEPYVVC